jgi:hypothetical protein
MLATIHMLDEAPPRPIERPAQVIYVPEDYDVPFLAEPGDTIIVIMYPDGDPVDRCNHMGGEPIFNPFTTIYTCEKVDF